MKLDKHAIVWGCMSQNMAIIEKINTYFDEKINVLLVESQGALHATKKSLELRYFEENCITFTIHETFYGGLQQTK